MNGTHLLHSLTSRFLLRDAETRARRFGEVERRDFAVQLALARQKLDSAQVLWAHQQYVEGLRLAEESVTEALRSAELCQYILPAGTAIDDAAEPVWAQVLRELGSRPEHIQDALLCQRGLPGPRPTLNSQITARERGYFQKAIQAGLSRGGPIAAGGPLASGHHGQPLGARGHAGGQLPGGRWAWRWRRSSIRRPASSSKLSLRDRSTAGWVPVPRRRVAGRFTWCKEGPGS